MATPTTSGTTSFNLTVDEIIQEAYDNLEGEHVTSYDAVRARRALNLLFIDIQNRDIPLASIKKNTLTVTDGTSEYTLDSEVIDVLDVYITRDSVDTELSRIPLFKYNHISNKTQEGQPSQFVAHRDRDAVTMYVYPTPDNSTDVITYWSIEKIEDVSASFQTMDISPRYQPAIIAGLSYNLGIKRKGISLDRLTVLKQDYEEKLSNAVDEDRERVSFFALPRIRRA